MSASSLDWAAEALGHRFRDPGLLRRALTHPSHGEDHYQRLEFLGDRVLGLVMAAWLYGVFPDEPEGKLARRLNALVSGGTCANMARSIAVGGQIRLGRQARDDGAAFSDNVLGDAMEALIGALYLDSGWDAARALIERLWGPLIDTRERAPLHPKSALQEWAAAKDVRPPVYTLLRRSGAHHAPRFEVEVAIDGLDRTTGEGGSKQEAETAAAIALLARLTQ